MRVEAWGGWVLLGLLAGCSVQGGADAECATDDDCPDGMICKDAYLCVDEDAPFAREGEGEVPAPGEGDGEGEGEGEGEPPVGGEGEGEGEGEPPNPCGNGAPDDGEECDPSADLSDVTCESLDAHHRGTPVCTELCFWDASPCIGGVCQDGERSQGEVCDPSADATARCTALGLKGGDVACDAECGLGLGGCRQPEVCGDGWVGIGEECDPSAAPPACGDCDAGCGLDRSGCPAPCERDCLAPPDDDGAPPWPLTPLGPGTGWRLFDSVCHRADERGRHGDDHLLGVRVAVHWAAAGQPPTPETLAGHLTQVNRALEGAGVELFLERFEHQDALDGPAQARAAAERWRSEDPSVLPVVLTQLQVAGLPSAHGVVLNADNPEWLQVAATVHLLGRLGGLAATHACPGGIPEPPGDCGRWGDGLCDTLFDPGPQAPPGAATGACRDFGQGQPACTLQVDGCQVECPGGASADAANALSHHLHAECAAERTLTEEQALTLRCVLRNEQRSIAFALCEDGAIPAPEACSGADEDCDGVRDEGRCPPEGDGPDDGFEPNDEASAPAELSEGAHLRLRVAGDDPDWYSLTVPPWTELSVRAVFDGDLADLDLRLEDEGGVLVSGSTRTGDRELIVARTAADPAGFVLGVSVPEGGDAGYDLHAAFDELDCLDLDDDLHGVHCPDGGDCDELDDAVFEGADELCNGRDDNCDGEVDEGFGEVQCGLGQCAHLIRECVDGEAPQCQPLVGAEDERCDALDHDCDGNHDDAPGVGNECTRGLGQCRQLGLVECDVEDQARICNAAAPPVPEVEQCDGLDNDCDGLVDDDGTGLSVEFSDPLGPLLPPWHQPFGGWQLGGEGWAVGRSDDPRTVVLAREVGHVEEFHAWVVFDRSHLDVGVGLVVDRRNARDQDGGGIGFRWSPAEEELVLICGDREVTVPRDQPFAPLGTALRFDVIYDGDRLELREGPMPRAGPGGLAAFTESCPNTDEDWGALAVSGLLTAPDHEVRIQRVVLEADRLGQTCYSGQLGTLDVGECRAGRQLCQAEGVFGGDCLDEVTPAESELCDGLDDDCDDSVDEDFDIGEPCTAGQGVCAVDGVVQCSEDGLRTECGGVADEAAAGVALCNDLDDDCDGDLDEGFDAGGACVIAVGDCDAQGTRVCNADGQGTTCSVIERCDGEDQDCDGEIDEGVHCGPAWLVETVVDAEAGYAETSVAIDVGAGEPAITYAVAGRADISRRIDGAWTHQTITGANAFDSTSITFAPDGTTHVMVGRGETDQHWHMQSRGGAWQSRGPLPGRAPGSDRSVTVDPDGIVRWVTDHDPGTTSRSWRQGPDVDDSVDHGDDDSGTPSVAALPGSPYAVTFSGSATSSVRYCEAEGGVWSCDQIGRDVGTSTSLAIGQDDRPWVAFHNERTQALQVAHRTGDGWRIETVDDDGPAGMGASLAVDEDGRPRVAYVGGTQAHVRHAVRQGAGAWDLETVDWVGGASHPSLAIDGAGVAHICYASDGGAEVRRAWQPRPTNLNVYPERLDLRLDEAAAPADQLGTSARRRRNQLFELPLLSLTRSDDPATVLFEELDGAATDRHGRANAAGTGQAGGFASFGDADLEGGTARTACAWIRPTANPAGRKAIMMKGAIGRRVWDLSITTGAGGPTAVVDWTRPDFGGGIGASGPWTVPLGQWGHLCGTLEAGVASIYVDGVLAARNDSGNPDFVLATGGANMTVGGEQSFPGSYTFPGDIDQIWVLTRAMDAAEIRGLALTRADPGGETLPGAQTDFDDVRVLEDGREIEFERIGAMPLADRREDLDEHVAHYWRLDGGQVVDMVGGEEGIVTGAVQTRGRFGAAGGGVHLDGDDRLDTRLTFAPGADEAFTIELWARVIDAQGDDNTLFSFNNSGFGGGEIQLWCQRNGLRGSLYSGPAESVTPLGTSKCDTGLWKHFALVRGGGRVKLYVDGLKEADVADRTTSFAPGIPIMLGASHRPDNLLRFLRGDLDDVVIHTVARSEDYLYRRAHPTPSLRWFVRTRDQADPDSGRYPFARYTLRWGAAGAGRSPLEARRGLLGPERGYLAWWRFEDFRSNLAVDSTRTRIHALFNQTPAPAGGIQGAAIDLKADGIRAPMRTSERDRFPFGHSLTVEMVVHADQEQNETLLLDNDANGGSSWTWRREIEANVHGFSCRLPNGNAAVLDGPNLEPFRWYALACAASPGLLRSYVDGDLAGELEGRGQALGRNGLDLVVGSHASGDDPFRGRFDEVRLMSRALPPEELLDTRRIHWTPVPNPVDP